MWDLLISPFADFAFMRRALAASLALSLGCGPIGVFLVLRRMSLVGDAMSHAILPGAAAGFLAAGFSLPALGLGGLAAGLIVALLAGFASRITKLEEDASFAGFYLVALALGVVLVATRGSNIDLLHLLFGTILAIDNLALYTVASIATITLISLALIYRPLVIECVDPGFLRAAGGPGALVHALFLILLVLNLVGGFQALGTLMAIGLMMLPAAAARLWSARLGTLLIFATSIGFLSAVAGLLISFYANLPSGPSIVLTAGGIYLLSLLFGRQGGALTGLWPRRHLAR